MAAASASGDFVLWTETEILPTFSKIYKWAALSLVVNGMYPFGPHQGWRRILWTTVFFFISSAFCICCYSLMLHTEAWDISEITRHFALIIPLVVMMWKMWLSATKKAQFQSIIDEINNDYIEFVHAPKKYKRIHAAIMGESLRAQTSWILISSIVSLSFPAVAAYKMLHHALHHNYHQKYMVYELYIPFLESYKYKTPIFELIFAYEFLLVCFCITNFTGFDTAYLIAAQHGTGQLKIMTTRLCDLFEMSLEPDDMHRRLRIIVQKHQKIFRYAKRVQRFYSSWFTAMVCLSSIQICLTLYQITEALAKGEVNMEFMIFAIGSVMQIYMSCKHSAVFSDASSEAAIDIYRCGWENNLDKNICFILKFMIARAQIPIKFNASYICPMDMNGFTSIINSAYSYFTLLRTNK